MGYACPVCDAPQRDAEHLANHLALTAMVHGEDHESWLDEHAPGWADEGPEGLGDRVAPLASSAEYDEVFEDTVHGHVGEGDHDHGSPPVDPPDAPPSPATPDDEATRETIAEARELTRRMIDAETDSTTDDAADERDGTDGTDSADDGDPEGAERPADDGDDGKA